MEARNREYTSSTRRQIEHLQQLGWYHSLELPDGTVLQGLQSIEQLRARLARFPIPQNLTGKRVLDIGAWDGWFSFEMERRGAQVVALDSIRIERFEIAKRLMNSDVEYRIGDICRINPAEFGSFDIVLFFGVLYHVKHPLLALENVCRMTREVAFVESYVIDDGRDLNAPPLMEFYECDELRGQFDNWCGPNTPCLLAMCRTAGFARVKFEGSVINRAHVTCWRTWPALDAEHGLAPWIISVENSISRDHHFSEASDDYVAIWFKTEQTELTPENVFVTIGSFASRPVWVGSTGGDGWHLNCILPPGIGPGWHDVSLRVKESPWTNKVRIGVDVTAPPAAVAASSNPDVVIQLVTDGRNWERFRIAVGAQSSMSLWVSGLPEDVTATALAVRLNGWDMPATFLSQPDAKGERQINAELPSGLKPGSAAVTVAGNGWESPAIEVQLISLSDSRPVLNSQ